MNLHKTIVPIAAALYGKAKALRLPRLPFPVPQSGDAREITRAAAAGAALFALAAAGLGGRSGFQAFRVDAGAAGATVSVGWGYDWIAYAGFGAMAGAAFGALAAFVALRWLKSGAASALLAVGAVAGVVAGTAWGGAVARERYVEVRAQHASAPPMNTAGRGANVSIVNGPVRLSSNVAREMNVPLLSFMILGATVVGAFAARGLAEVLPVERRAERPQTFVPPVPWAEAKARRQAAAMPVG